MNTYTSFKTHELVSSTELVKNFKTNIDNVVNKVVDKIAIMKNNKPEAVVISLQEYERLLRLEALSSHLDIYETVIKRQSEKTEDFISHEEMLEKLGITEDEL
jgi:prevent-host-death family protein